MYIFMCACMYVCMHVYAHALVRTYFTCALVDECLCVSIYVTGPVKINHVSANYTKL